MEDTQQQSCPQKNEDKDTDIDKKKIVELLSWNPRAIWSYAVVSDECSICKNKLTEKCITCTNNNDIVNTTCKIARGNCGHGFHYDCISNWKSHGGMDCPIDMTPFTFDYEDLDLNTDWIKLKKNKKK